MGDTYSWLANQIADMFTPSDKVQYSILVRIEIWRNYGMYLRVNFRSLWLIFCICLMISCLNISFFTPLEASLVSVYIFGSFPGFSPCNLKYVKLHNCWYLFWSGYPNHPTHLHRIRYIQHFDIVLLTERCVFGHVKKPLKHSMHISLFL